VSGVWFFKGQSSDDVWQSFEGQSSDGMWQELAWPCVPTLARVCNCQMYYERPGAFSAPLLSGR